MLAIANGYDIRGIVTSLHTLHHSVDDYSTACAQFVLLCTIEAIICVSKLIVYPWKHCCVHVKCSHKHVADNVGQSFRERCIPALWFVAGTTKSSEASDGTVRDKHSWWWVSEMWQCEI